MRFYVINDMADALLETRAGAMQFCSWCKRNEVCDNGIKGNNEKLGAFYKPKILRCNTVVLHYLFHHVSGDYQYPVVGTLQQQPEWFLQLLGIAKTEYSRAKADKQKRLNKKQGTGQNS